MLVVNAVDIPFPVHTEMAWVVDPLRVRSETLSILALQVARVRVPV